MAAVACCALWLDLVSERIHRPVPPPQVALAHPPAPPLAVPAGAMPAKAAPPLATPAPAMLVRAAPPLAAPTPAMSARAVPPRVAPVRTMLPRAVRHPGLPPLNRKPAPPQEQLIVRIVTDDPDVVIYWIANLKGE
jgi:hypothetical protein